MYIDILNSKGNLIAKKNFEQVELCPVCGTKPQLSIIINTYINQCYFNVFCPNNHLLTWGEDSTNEAIKAWNKHCTYVRYTSWLK